MFNTTSTSLNKTTSSIDSPLVKFTLCLTVLILVLLSMIYLYFKFIKKCSPSTKTKDEGFDGAGDDDGDGDVVDKENDRKRALRQEREAQDVTAEDTSDIICM